MSNIEKKLAEYRVKKKLSFKRDRLKTVMKTLFSEKKEDKEIVAPLQIKEDSVINNLYIGSSLKEDETDDTLNCCTYMDLIYYGLCFLLWATLYIIFIQLEFGTVYLIVSGLIGIYFNTRTKPKKPNEISAYSVFNENCESIDGTLKAEQFEREIRYGGI